MLKLMIVRHWEAELSGRCLGQWEKYLGDLEFVIDIPDSNIHHMIRERK